jgi:hypothetical protein
MSIRNGHINFKLFLDKIDSEAYPEISPEEIDVFINESIKRFVKSRYGRTNIYRQGFEEIQKRTEDLKALVRTKKALITNSEYQQIGERIFRADLSQLTNLDDTSTIDEYQFYLKSMVHITYGTCDKWDEAELIQHDVFTRVRKDPFNKPDVSNALIFFEGNAIHIWTAPNCTIDGFVVTFIKRHVDVKLGVLFNGNTTATTNIITNVSNLQNARIFVNDPISGPGIPEGSIIVAKGNEGGNLNTVTISNNITTTVVGATFDTSVEFELSEHTHEEIVQMAVTIALENIESRRVQTQPVLNEGKIE